MERGTQWGVDAPGANLADQTASSDTVASPTAHLAGASGTQAGQMPHP